MSGLYSKGKAIIEAEKQKTVTLDALTKAKGDFEILAAELGKTAVLAHDPQWLNGVSRLILKATQDYEEQKALLKAHLAKIEAGQKDGIRAAVLEVVQKANSLDGTFEEVKTLLSQIFRVVTQDAELKRRTLENINRELAR